MKFPHIYQVSSVEGVAADERCATPTNQVATELSLRQRGLLGEFAQAVWFLIDTEFLPDPNDGGEFVN